jgi:hypothetical protein
MRIPKSFKFKKSRWTIAFGTKKLDTSKYRGICYLDKKQIFIDPELPRNEQEETLVHELLHAVWPAGVCGEKMEEKLVEKLSRSLYEVLASNKTLLKR